MSLETDEDEHSIEMHLPYVYKVFENYIDEIKIVPILIGALTESAERQYGKLLAPYLDDPQNLFIISSDFCHWGVRFDYTYYADEDGNVTQSLARLGGKNFVPPGKSQKIFESIRQLDHEGMEKIEQGDHANFCKYLARTKNTICGRHPIGVLLAALAETGKDESENNAGIGTGYRIQFVRYAQSSNVLSTSDSSVSYASAFVQQQQQHQQDQ
ncbi:Protein memo1 [Haplosporangium sp. Z 11]|nr:Protein memo1 [Haplosporangium sp. Z 11]